MTDVAVAPLLVGVVGLGAAHVVARYRGAPRLAGVLKPVPVALLVLLAARAGGPYGSLLVVGLLCSIAGDVCLVFPRGFLPGLVGFLVAHLVYIAAFTASGGATAAWLVLLPFAALGGAMLAGLRPYLGALRVPVAVYVAVLVVMGWRAAARALAPATPWPSGALALAGAVLFMASDAVLAVDRFARRFAAADAAVMTTYYAAQALIALSAAV